MAGRRKFLVHRLPHADSGRHRPWRRQQHCRVSALLSRKAAMVSPAGWTFSLCVVRMHLPRVLTCGVDSPVPFPRLSERVRCSPGPGWTITNSSSATQALQRTGVLSAEATCDIQEADSIEGHSAGDDIACTIKLANDGTTTLTMIEVTAGLFLPER